MSWYRADAVDRARWLERTPWWKFVAVALGTLSLSAFVLPCELAMRQLVKLVNALLELRDDLWRWSRFVPDVIAAEDVPSVIHFRIFPRTDLQCCMCDSETDTYLPVCRACIPKLNIEQEPEDSATLVE